MERFSKWLENRILSEDEMKAGGTGLHDTPIGDDTNNPDWRKRSKRNPADPELIDSIRKALKFRSNDFLRSLITQVDSGQGLTDSQVATAQKVLDSLRKQYYASLPIVRYAAQNAKSPQKPKEYVGVKGEKITLPVTIVKTKTKANPHSPLGTMQYIKMEDESGNIIVWFNAGRPVEATEGKKVVVSGTVVKHQIFAGSKVTHIKRAKIN